jgi:hypothetical protein
MIANLYTLECLWQHASLPGTNQSTGSPVFHELLTLPGTAIGTENNSRPFSEKQKHSSNNTATSVGQIIYTFQAWKKF